LRTGFQSLHNLVGINVNGVARTSLADALLQFLFDASWPSNVPVKTTLEARAFVSRELCALCLQ